MWRYIAKDGEFAFEGEFREAAAFFGGLAWVEVPDGHTFIDRAGQILCGTRFEQASSFFFGRALQKKDRWFGYLDVHGHWAIDPAYHYGEHFREGLARVRKAYSHQFLDLSGATVIAFEGGSVSSFRCGRSKVQRKGKTFFMDRTGQIVLGPYDYADDFSEEMAHVCIDGRRYFVDTAGQIQFEHTSDYVGAFRSGRIPFAKNGLMGVLSRDGTVIVPPRFQEIHQFSGGVAVVEHEGLRGVIDADGKVLFLKQFADFPFWMEDGLLAFSHDRQQYGYVNANGDVVIPPRFKYARGFSEGLAAVRIG